MTWSIDLKLSSRGLRADNTAREIGQSVWLMISYNNKRHLAVDRRFKLDSYSYLVIHCELCDVTHDDASAA